MFGKEKPTNHDLEIFLIYDSKVNAYRDPIISPNKWEMFRSYERLLKNNPDDQLITNAEDFALFKIGEYFKKTGTITLHEKEHQANFHELKFSLIQRQKDQMGIVPT